MGPVTEGGGGALGSIRNRKTVDKIIQNRKKIGSKPKTACKSQIRKPVFFTYAEHQML